mgnify:CR=1 FL=1
MYWAMYKAARRSAGAGSSRAETMRTSDLPRKIAHELSLEILSGVIAPGQPFRSQPLADRFGVSRSPIREALTLLVERGLVVRIANRGFYASKTKPASASETLGDIQAHAPANDYQRLAEDWLNDRIGADVTEQMLRERYGLTKARLNDLLMRAAREGWAERKAGYGWRFLPVAKTAEAFDQIYRFRMAIEPAALLDPGFRFDAAAAAELRHAQERMLAIDIDILPAERLLENGAHFHEVLARMSGNHFFHMALVQVNRMRRLMEYRARLDRERLVVQCREHLEILDVVERGDLVEASLMMGRHLSGALQRKSPVAWSLYGAGAGEATK